MWSYPDSSVLWSGLFSKNVVELHIVSLQAWYIHYRPWPSELDISFHLPPTPCIHQYTSPADGMAPNTGWVCIPSQPPRKITKQASLASDPWASTWLSICRSISRRTTSLLCTTATGVYQRASHCKTPAQSERAILKAWSRHPMLFSQWYSTVPSQTTSYSHNNRSPMMPSWTLLLPEP